MLNTKYVLITPARNEEAFIEKTLASMAAQTVLPQRWVIVDDGSTDDSEKTIKNIIGNDERFKFYKNDKNYGCGYTKRKCAE